MRQSSKASVMWSWCSMPRDTRLYVTCHRHNTESQQSCVRGRHSECISPTKKVWNAKQCSKCWLANKMSHMKSTSYRWESNALTTELQLIVKFQGETLCRIISSLTAHDMYCSCQPPVTKLSWSLHFMCVMVYQSIFTSCLSQTLTFFGAAYRDRTLLLCLRSDKTLSSSATMLTVIPHQTILQSNQTVNTRLHCTSWCTCYTAANKQQDLIQMYGKRRPGRDQHWWWTVCWHR